MTDWQKWKRYMIFDRSFQVRVGLLAVLVFCLQWEVSVLKRDGLRIWQLRADQGLVARIPELEQMVAARLKPAPARKADLRQDDSGFHLEGILMRDEGLVALVNGEIKTVGDTAGKYEIIQINRDGVAVADRVTGIIETMTMPNDTPAVKASTSAGSGSN